MTAPGTAAAEMFGDTAPSVDSALAAARRHLPAAESRLLLRHVLGRDAAWLAAHGETLLPALAVARFAAAVERRIAGEPMAYVIGEREFFGRNFRVSPDVLIPRPETELLVELSLAKLATMQHPRLLELGTGSGCIAVSLAGALPQADVVAADVSSAALAVAADNARRHGVSVEFRSSDWFAAIDGEYDLIVSNPPYIAALDPHLRQGDLRFEPSQALIGGGDGLAALRAIVAAAPRFLAPGAWLLLEHGYDQGAAVAGLMRAAGLLAIESHRDLAGLDRVVAGRMGAVAGTV